MGEAARRCILLFARTAQAEASAKGLLGAEALFVRTARRVQAAADALANVDLVVVGSALGVRATTELRQRGVTLTARLNAAFDDVFALGYDQVVAVGLDSPGLEFAHLKAAWEALEHHDGVLGPCPDGGVYLIGLARKHADALKTIPWGTSLVACALQSALPGAHWLAQLMDVDRPGDLTKAQRVYPFDRLLGVLVARLRLIGRPRVPRRSLVHEPGRLPDSRAPPLR